MELLFTAETGFQPLPCRCRVRPLGGWAQREVVLDALRASSAAPLTVDAGGWLGGNVTPEIAALTADAYGRMSYDALNMGPVELERLREGVTGAESLPLVCGHPDRPAGVPAYRVVAVGGRRIGIVGAARFEPSAPTPAEQVEAALADMPPTDLVVVLLAGGLGPMNTIADGGGADVVIYGDGARTPSPVTRKRTIAAAPGSRGRYVGRLVVPARSAGADACTYELVAVEKDLRGPDVLVRLALRAAELREGARSLREKTFDYVTE